MSPEPKSDKKLDETIIRNTMEKQIKNDETKNLEKTTQIVAALTFGPWDPSEELRLAARILANKYHVISLYWCRF